MKPLAILYLGPKSGTCLQRAGALERLGHQVEHIELRLLLPATPWVDRITWQLGGDWFERRIIAGLTRVLGRRRYDLAYVDQGEWVTPAVIRFLRQHAKRVINYSIDDPLGPRDRARSRAYRQSVSHYDLCVVMRQQNVVEARRRGARDVMRVFMSADELQHAPLSLSHEERRRWQSDVLFVGTWFPERGPFMVKLLQLGLPLTLYGHNWAKAPEWPVLRNHWKQSHLEGREYVAAIQCSRVALGLLSKGNRDQHTTRSTEIPAIGGLLCAERTAEHKAMYVEGEEALFWGSVEECASACRWALQDEPKRRSLAAAGRERTFRNSFYNQAVLATIIEQAVGADCPKSA